MKLLYLKDRVIQILRDYPETRDSDELLIVHVWSSESNLSRKDRLGDFIDLFVSGSLSKTESIRRVRQKAQEHNKDLRGSVYYDRHKISLDVKTELIHFSGDDKKK